MTSAATHRIGRAAVRALYREAVLSPKPGLVSAADNGAHDDMSLATFYRSIVALRSYFPAMAALGRSAAPWLVLVTRGRVAEAAMLRATGGVNTHRGAIFHLGLLCAAAGARIGLRGGGTAAGVAAHVAVTWGETIRRAANVAPASHGAQMTRRFGAGGAREEAARGFPAVLEHALPAYRSALRARGDATAAAVQALFVLIAHVDDSNLLWRGGLAGLHFAQTQSRAFLDAGGVHAADWRRRAGATHAAFVARRLSPGGSADLLAVTLFLAELEAAACTS